MTTSAPPPMPPPVPPPEPPRVRPAWFPLAVAGGVVAVVGLGLLAAGVFSKDPTAAGTSTTTATSVAVTTTVPQTSTTAAPTTTVAVTTTTVAATTTTVAGPGVVLHDAFDGSTQAQALFGPDYMTISVAEGSGTLAAMQGAFVLPAMYPISVGDASLALEFRTDLVNPGARAGMLVLSEDPGDGALSHYVLVLIDEAAGNLVIAPFDDGFGPETVVPLPPEAGFAADEFNLLSVVVVDGALVIALNDTYVTTWAEPFAASSGWFGLVVVSGGPGDALTVRDLIVLG